jgi:hypothetical protein
MAGPTSDENIGLKRGFDQEGGEVHAKKLCRAGEENEEGDVGAAELESAKQSKVSSATPCSSTGLFICQLMDAAGVRPHDASWLLLIWRILRTCMLVAVAGCEGPAASSHGAGGRPAGV